MSTTQSEISGVTLATLAKDIRLEWRSKDAINSMLFFPCWSWWCSVFLSIRTPKSPGRLPAD